MTGDETAIESVCLSVCVAVSYNTSPQDRPRPPVAAQTDGWKDTHADIEIDSQIDIEINSQINIETGGPADTQAGRQADTQTESRLTMRKENNSIANPEGSIRLNKARSRAVYGQIGFCKRLHRGI